MTKEEGDLIDFLFEGAEVHYTERKSYIADGCDPINTFIANPGMLSSCYRSWHIHDRYKGEVKIFKIVLTEENKKRIHEYITSKM